MGVDRVTTLNLKVVQTDVERGLILVEGAVPGAKGGWITAARRGRRRSCRRSAPKPGKFRLPDAAAAAGNAEAAPARRPPARRARDMELKVTTLDGKDAGSVELSDDDLRPRAARGHPAALRASGSCAKRQRGTHDVKNRAEINRTGKKMYRQKGTGSARHGPAKVNLFRGGGRSFGPTPRSHAIDLPKKVRALALRARFVRQGQGRRHHRARQGDRGRKARPSALQTNFDQARAQERARSSTAPRSTPASAWPRATFRNIDVLPVQGINVYDILRRHTLVLTKSAR